MIVRKLSTGTSHRVVECNGLLFTGGITAQRLPAGIEDQIRQVLGQLAELLEAGGSSMTGVLSTTVYLTDMAHREALNAIWVEAFGGELPTRATVGVSALTRPEMEIELTAIAAVEDR